MFFILIFSFCLCAGYIYAEKDTLTQVSTIDALLTGIYDGEMTLTELKQYGDFGLGTFNNLNGEMIVVDGHFYRIASDGTVKQPDNKTKTPFAAVTFFEADKTLPLQPGLDYRLFKKQIDKILPTLNIFYGIKILGIFKAVKTRSVPKQNKPYRPLKEILKTQPVFTFQDVEGTIIGFRSPPYVKGINIPGYHLHFLTKDKKSGGHILEFTIKKATLEIDETSKFLVILPKDKAFYGADLTLEKQSDLEKVEQ